MAGEIRYSAESCTQTNKPPRKERADRAEEDSERAEDLPEKTIEQNDFPPMSPAWTGLSLK